MTFLHQATLHSLHPSKTLCFLRRTRILSHELSPCPMKANRFYLEHIHEQTCYLIETSAGLRKDAFLQNQTLILAFERSLEIIGEAVAKIDDDFREAHPAIPWRKIRGLRNVVAHMYWSVDYDIVWHVITTDIPLLKKQIAHVLTTLP